MVIFTRRVFLGEKLRTPTLPRLPSRRAYRDDFHRYGEPGQTRPPSTGEAATTEQTVTNLSRNVHVVTQESGPRVSQ